MGALGELRARAEACAAGERERERGDGAGPMAAASGPCRVRARREHGRRLVFLDLEEEPAAAVVATTAVGAGVAAAAAGGKKEGGAPTRLQAVLDARDAPSRADERPGRWAALTQLAGAGSVVVAEGTPGRSRRGEPSLFISQLRLLRVHADPSCVMRLLRAVSEGDLGPGEAEEALQCDKEELEVLLLQSEEHPAAARAQAVLVSRRLSGKTAGWTRERRPRIRHEDRDLLDSYESRAARWPLKSVGPGPRLDLGIADPALNLPNSEDKRRRRYIEERKRPQIEWLIEQIRNLERERGGAFRSILDIGGGRGDLALAMAHCFPEARVRVLDANAGSLLAGEARAAEAELKNVTFTVQDVESATAGEWAAESDLIVGLHACGGLSDALLRLALGPRASFLICTCCFAGNGHLCRPGQWPFEPAEEKAVLCRLAESIDRDIATPAQHAVNAGRLQAAVVQAPELRAGVLAFPREFSPRNLVLRGYFLPNKAGASAPARALAGEKRPRDARPGGREEAVGRET